MNDRSTWDRRKLRVAGIGAALLVSLLARPAAADKTDDDALRAEELFKEARAAIDRNDYAAACPKFEESLALVRRAGTLFNLAQCEEHEGRLVTAMRYYKEGIVVLDPGDPRLAPSKKKLAEIEPRIPFLTIKPKAELPKDTRVTIDGKEAEGVGVALPVNPGKRTIAVLAPKHTEETYLVEVGEAEQVELLVSAGKVIVEPPRLTPADLLSIRQRRIAAVSLLGVGALGFVAAGITGGLVVSTYNEVEKNCVGGRCATKDAYEAAQNGQTLLVVNTVAWGVGIAGAGAGAVLYLLANKKQAEKTGPAQSLLVGPGFVGVRGSF
ncbi:tetratricopeptide repeat protein [Polyangium sorediatum]|uniref:Tetratricopeptide repeat protein n=1 Tax=Polyangium sorediatum TaxID=889274 RepID=A0ABT6NKH8_9BACT|nr:tetratricopeptide repeat protein [Polyangium sorediatum]MDI1428819.1 tetratricopeptide repeat protein [Polyangium sorediatum]